MQAKPLPDPGIDEFVWSLWEDIIGLLGWKAGMVLKNLSDEVAGIIAGMMIATLIWTYVLSKVNISPKLKNSGIVAMRVEKNGKYEIVVAKPHGFIHTFMCQLAVLIVRFYPNHTLRLNNMRTIKVVLAIVIVVLTVVVLFGLVTGLVVLDPHVSTPP